MVEARLEQCAALVMSCTSSVYCGGQCRVFEAVKAER